MTRFARAKGSKASNQRIPDESTPWAELRKQNKGPTIESTSREGVEEETNWKEIINTEKKVEENLNSVWCDFSDSEDNKMCNVKKKKLKKDEQLEKCSADVKRPGKRKAGSLTHDVHSEIQERKTKKKHKKNENIDFENGPSNSDKPSHTIEMSTSKHEEEIGVSNPSDWVGGFEWNDSGQTDNPSQSRQSFDNSFQKKQSFNNDKQPSKFHGSKNWSITAKQNKKFSTDTHLRRKYDQGDITLDVNGEKIVVTRLDGFYIRKEDAERITELERDMLKRGISKEEIRAVVKKERRNAEKSLARQKKKVCFHCRKGGHNLSSCPKLNEGGAQIIGSGICYKCGSTEHSHIQCRVASGQTFKFATCFICKEEGHIAKQCPDNPRGLYPDGGACKLCGDVTHLKKNCPSLPTKATITLGTIDQDIETLGDIEDRPKESIQKKKNKIIKFK